MPDTTLRSATISVLVENEPGILARVVGLFSGRGYNIDSLTVAPVESEGRMLVDGGLSSNLPIMEISMSRCAAPCTWTDSNGSAWSTSRASTSPQLCCGGLAA